MASYTELHTQSSDAAFLARVAVACAVAADVIRVEPQETDYHDSRLRWASRVLTNPTAEASRMVWGVLAQNRALTIAQIQSSTDAQLQTAVNAAINLFATVS